MKKSFSYAPDPFKKMPKGTKKLAVAIAIYVPDTDKEGKKISESEFKKRIKEVEMKLLEFFGGHTTDVLEHGEFLGKNKILINERVFKIYVFTGEKVYKKHREALKKWVLEKKKEWNQETIACEFEGDLFYL